jgi:hypothetical protein
MLDPATDLVLRCLPSLLPKIFHRQLLYHQVLQYILELAVVTIGTAGTAGVATVQAHPRDFLSHPDPALTAETLHLRQCHLNPRASLHP